MGPIRGQATPGSRPELWDVFSSPFVQSNGLGGTVYGGGEDFRIGLIREPGKVVVEGESGRSCTVVVRNRCGGLEEPSPLSEEAVRVLTSGFQSPRSRRKPRARKSETRNDEGPTRCPPCWTWEEPTGPAERCERSKGTLRIRGSPGGNCPVRRASGLVTVRVH